MAGSCGIIGSKVMAILWIVDLNSEYVLTKIFPSVPCTLLKVFCTIGSKVMAIFVKGGNIFKNVIYSVCLLFKTCDSGHYIAAVYCKERKSFCVCDDERNCEIPSFDEELERTVYLIVYERQ